MGGWTSQEPHFGQQRTTAVAMGFDAMDRRRESVKQIECGQGQHLHVNVGFKLVGKVFDLKSLAAVWILQLWHSTAWSCIFMSEHISYSLFVVSYLLCLLSFLFVCCVLSALFVVFSFCLLCLFFCLLRLFCLFASCLLWLAVTKHFRCYFFATCSAGVVVDCGPLDNPENGRVNVTGTTEGSTATYSCFLGYRLKEVVTRTCAAEGWSGTVPTCERESTWMHADLSFLLLQCRGATVSRHC